MTETELKEEAKEVDVISLYHEGVCYLRGEGVEVDTQKAAELFEEARKQGDSQSQNGLGLYCKHEEAAKWFRKAAEIGSVDGQFMLGICHYYGAGVEKDWRQAVKWWAKAAKQGHETAQDYLDKAVQDYFDEVVQDIAAYRKTKGKQDDYV